MHILYIGDIMGEPGMRAVAEVLPKLKQKHQIDLVIAQSENVTAGKGISADDFHQLRQLGIDFCTGGNWSLNDDSIIPLLNDPSQPIIRPANYPKGTPGLGYKYIQDVLVVSLLGSIVGKDADKPLQNPLQIIDKILAKEKPKYCLVNLHGDYSSEKVVIGHYLDGRLTAVVGDHWHVPTADARVLPKSTAHITDVGMCGTLDASLGVSLDSIIPRWRDGLKTRNVIETNGRLQFNAVLIEAADDGRSKSIEQIQTII